MRRGYVLQTKSVWRNGCATLQAAKMEFGFMLGSMDAALLVGFTTGCSSRGRRRNGSGTAGAEAAGSPRRANPKTGERATTAPKSHQYNHRSPRTAIYFLSRNCHQPRPAQRQAKVRALCG